MPDDAPTTPAPEAPSPKPEEEAAPPSARGGWRKWAPLGVAAGVPLLLFFVLPPLAKSGLWDPYELNVADLSRRIAINLNHSTQLALENADNTLPHLNDLGRPQGPFTMISVGFSLFGLHEWAGRLPLALVGLLGVLATYAFIRRLFDKRTGAYAAVALTTMPVYFVQARSILGDVCTMASLAMAFGGLAVCAFDRDENGPTSFERRLPWLGMAAVGLFGGFMSRGGLLGIGVPTLGVGLSWAVTRVVGRAGPKPAKSSTDIAGDIVGGLSLLGGIYVAVVAALAIARGDAASKDLQLSVGAMLHLPTKYPTFDFYIAAVGHALAPWSAFLPFAFGRLLMSPLGVKGAVQERESLGRVAILVGAGVAFVAHGYLAARTDLIAFTGPALCAAAAAVAIRDFERGAPASIAVGIGTLVVAAVLHHDFHELPDKAYQAFGVTGATFPDSFKDRALTLWWVVLGGFGLCALLTWAERETDRKPFDPANYAKVLRTFREAYDGMLALVYFATVAGALLAGAFVFIGMRMHAHWLPQMSSTFRDVVLNAWYVVAFGPLGAVFALMFACDVWLWAFNRSKPLSVASLTRGFEPFEELIGRVRPDVLGAAPVGAGAPTDVPETAPTDKPGADAPKPLDRYEWWVALLVIAPLMLLAIPVIAFLGWYLGGGFKPYVAALLAVPSGVAFFLAMGVVGDLLRHRAPALALGGGVVGFVLCFFYYPALANQLSPKEVFESYRKVCPNAQLGLLGVGGRTSAYYAGGQPETLANGEAAYKWLTGGSGQRRCLALKSEELPKLNQMWREHAEPRTNLPILDARSSQILLAASSLEPKDHNDNPLNEMLLASPPHPQRNIDANMEDKLEVIGIDLLDDRGHPADTINPGKPYHLKTYYRVLGPVTTEWEAFIHIDGYHRRHNGDHKPMNGKYPMSLWLPGDLLMDDHEFKLEPNFTPGKYTIYFGLFVGDTRLKVKSGPNDGDNRINGGPINVQ